jgi:hypothetical protein
MITLFTLVILWGVFSIYRIYKKCKSMGIGFDPFEGTFEQYMGMFIGGILGGSIIIGILLYSIIKYLP